MSFTLGATDAVLEIGADLGDLAWIATRYLMLPHSTMISSAFGLGDSEWWNGPYSTAYHRTMGALDRLTGFTQSSLYKANSFDAGRFVGQVAFEVISSVVPIGHARHMRHLKHVNKLDDAARVARGTATTVERAAVRSADAIATIQRGGVRSANPVPLGGRAVGYARRTFDPDAAGGAIRALSTARIKVTSRGIDVVEQHLARFGPDRTNFVSIRRLRNIASGRLTATQHDLNFYSHELREFVRYRRLGWKTGQPTGIDARWELWNNAHTATLKDYGITDGMVYHPSTLRNP